jgi:hypothetical protein
MPFFDSPKNYTELLPKLSRTTFVTTLIFFIVLRCLEIVPYMAISSELVPALEKNKELFEWVISFGVIPILAASIAFILSAFFEMHNKIAKLLGIRFLWDKYFIARPIAKRAGSNMTLNKRNVEKLMKDLFYPEIKNLDSHFVHLFWRYALHFWILFEHMLISFLTATALTIFHQTIDIIWLWVWFLSVLFITAIQLIFVTGQKSTDQANQIADSRVRAFFDGQLT